MATDEKMQALLDAQQPRLDKITEAMGFGFSEEQLKGACSRGYVHLLIAEIIVSMQDTAFARLEALERKAGIMRRAKPITRSVTKVLAHDSEGRVSEFERLEAPSEELDMLARLRAVEQRMVEVEQSGIRYKGVWQKSEQYRVGDFVTHKGGCWAAMIASTGVTPGDGAIWKLAVKPGKDAR